MTPSRPTNFVWYELVTPDAASAAAFYGDVVGWSTRDAGHDDVPYTLLCMSDCPTAGIFTMTAEMRDAGARPGWIGYIGVDDVDGDADRVRAAGGTVLRGPADLPVGRFAVVSDPQGAAFILFRASAEMESSLDARAPGQVGWRELHAVDGRGAFPFYADMFGWTKGDTLDMGPMGTYQLFSAGAEPVGGMMTKFAVAPIPFWLFYVIVPAVNAAVKKVVAGGGRVANGPHQVPGGSWIVQCFDPQGAFFALTAPEL